MLKSELDLVFERSLVVALVVGAALGPSPACSALALLVLFSYKLADKYFHDNLHNETRRELAKLREDFTKVKAKQDQGDIKAAFSGGIRG